MADDLTAGLDEAIAEAQRFRRDEDFARFVCLAIRLAAAAEPDRIKEALAGVFGLEGVIETARRANARAIAALEKADEAAARLRSLAQAEEDFCRRIDEQHLQMDRLASRIGKAKDYLLKLRDEIVRIKQQLPPPRGAGPAAKPAPRK